MKLNRKQRIYSFVVFLPLFPIALTLSVVKHTCYLIADVLEKVGRMMNQFDRLLSTRYENFIRSVK